MSKRSIASLDSDADRDLDRRTKPHLESQSTIEQPGTGANGASVAVSAVTQSVLKQLAYPSTSGKPVSCPPFQLPTRLINFSYTPKHELEFTDSSMKYFVEPPLGAKLPYAYDRWIRKPEERGRIDSLLRAFSKVRQDEAKTALVRDVNVISWRGVMTRIMTAPYEQRDSWDLNVMCINGTMYLEEHLSDEKLQEKNNVQPHHRMQMYYGYAFESYCTWPTPTRPPSSMSDPAPGWSGDVDTHVQWCNVMRTKLGDIRMVIGGEVDCIKGSTKETVELKTSLTIRGAHDERKFEQKLLKFYFQSFLLGVPEIVVGFRTPNGEVKVVEHFKTMEIPRLVRGKPNAWDPSICLDWGHRFLKSLKELLSDAGNSDGKTVWRARFSPKEGVTVSKLDGNGMLDVEGGEDRVGFLPRWYWDEISATTESVEATAAETSAGTDGISEPRAATVGGWQF